MAADYEVSKEQCRATPVSFTVEQLARSVGTIRPELVEGSEQDPEARAVLADVLANVAAQTTVGGMVDAITAAFGKDVLVKDDSPKGSHVELFVGARHKRLENHKFPESGMLNLRGDIVQACSNLLSSVNNTHGNPLGKAFKALCNERDRAGPAYNGM